VKLTAKLEVAFVLIGSLFARRAPPSEAVPEVAVSAPSAAPAISAEVPDHPHAMS
jgi:hypothetical protein